MLLVRDAAAPCHPVIGIAALGSAPVGVKVRDEYLGWTGNQVWERLRRPRSMRLVRWMLNSIEGWLAELHTDDLIADGVLTREDLRRPRQEVIKDLAEASRQHRKDHNRCVQRGEHKHVFDVEQATEEDWRKQAETSLFRSKREAELATLLRAQTVLQQAFKGKATKAGLDRFLETTGARDTVARIVRKAKAERVGTVMAELTVCGAVPPYNELLGGKLVAMLATSPEVVVEYRRRYGRLPSIIASSMAAKPTIRPAELAFIGTSSLFDVRPNQYDRVSIPCEQVLEGRKGAIRYRYLGKTKGIGTFHFGEHTVAALSLLLSQSHRGQRVHSIFGEGVSPRLRKVRDGLDALGLPADELLTHGAPRLIYGVELAENAGNYLLGVDKKPRYLLPARRTTQSTEQIARWWTGRWLSRRIRREDVLERIRRHTLVHPIRHGARVRLPRLDTEQGLLFDS